jgi:SAM-dependent methyltransferase
MPSKLEAVDVGAGTGIFSRMLSDAGFSTVRAVEPNDAMREQGASGSRGTDIDWTDGSGGDTGLGDQVCDLVTMASSFHWVDFDAGCKEFHRILRPGGHFAALWNPRLVEQNPLLQEVEELLSQIAPNLKRVSSGRAKFTTDLTERLNASGWFKDVVYVEGRHIQSFTPSEYLGVWRSVNDVQVQLGKDRFGLFLERVAELVDGFETIETTYLTRAWCAQRSES